MPEIWLNYGRTDVVLDIRAENLEQTIEFEGTNLDSIAIKDKLNSIDFTKSLELVVLQNSKAVQKIISEIFVICEQKSIPFPKIFAEKHLITNIKHGLPEGSIINEFNTQSIKESNLVFLGELELDGLFGFENNSTRLLKKFGQEYMLNAYAKRKSNTPSPGVSTKSMDEAKRFTDNFEIQSIDILANSKGIIDIAIGHPSSTLSLTSTFEPMMIKDVGQHKSLIISTGKQSSNEDLSKSLSSLWNSYSAIKENGLAILIAECKNGLGSDAIQQFIEGRLNIDSLRNPSFYLDGMENLLFLNEIKQNFQIGLVTILPEFYSKKMGLIPLGGIKTALEYTLKTLGQKQKVIVVTDGSHLLLR